MRAVRWGLCLAVLIGTLLALVGGSPEAGAGTTRRGGPGGSESGDPAMIAPQLRRSIPLQQRAIEQLSGPRTPETLEEVARTIMQAYVLVRAAHQGIDNKMYRQRAAEGGPSVDPILASADRGVAEARRHIIRAHDGMRDVRPDESEEIERRIEHLNAAIAQIRRILGTIR